MGLRRRYNGFSFSLRFVWTAPSSSTHHHFLRPTLRRFWSDGLMKRFLQPSQCLPKQENTVCSNGIDYPAQLVVDKPREGRPLEFTSLQVGVATGVRVARGKLRFYMSVKVPAVRFTRKHIFRVPLFSSLITSVRLRFPPYTSVPFCPPLFSSVLLCSSRKIELGYDVKTAETFRPVDSRCDRTID